MSHSEAVKFLKDKGYDAEYVDRMVYVYYKDGDSIFEEVGKLLRDAGYNYSYGTGGRRKELSDGKNKTRNDKSEGCEED